MIRVGWSGDTVTPETFKASQPKIWLIKSLLRKGRVEKSFHLTPTLAKTRECCKMKLPINFCFQYCFICCQSHLMLAIESFCQLNQPRFIWYLRHEFAMDRIKIKSQFQQHLSSMSGLIYFRNGLSRKMLMLVQGETYCKRMWRLKKRTFFVR